MLNWLWTRYDLGEQRREVAGVGGWGGGDTNGIMMCGRRESDKNIAVGEAGGIFCNVLCVGTRIVVK